MPLLTDWRKKQRFKSWCLSCLHLSKDYSKRRLRCAGHVLFKQLVPIVERYIHEKVTVLDPADRKDLFLAPYYGWLVELLESGLRPDYSWRSRGGPDHRAESWTGVDKRGVFWTSRDVREVTRSHLNYAVADTQKLGADRHLLHRFA